MKWLLIGASAALFAPLIAAQENQDVPGVDDGIRAEDTLKPGLVGQYWNIGKEMKKFPDEVTCEPANPCRIDGTINFDVKEGRGFGDLPWKEYFAAIWTGVLRAPKDADYTFTLKSHDGSKLYLNGKLVIDHDGTHPLKESESKTVALKAGDHDLRIEYFQNKEGRLILSWKYEGIDKQVVPATALWHRFEKKLDAK